MKLAVLTSCIPHRVPVHPGISAVHLQAWAFLTTLRLLGHDVVLLPLIPGGDAVLKAQDREELRALGAHGVRVLEPMDLHALAKAGCASGCSGLALKVLARLGGPASPDAFYPWGAGAPAVQARLHGLGADAAIAFCSPEAMAVVSRLSGLTRAAFQGDIEYRPNIARASDPVFAHQWHAGPVAHLLRRGYVLTQRGRWRAHKTVAAGMDVLACSAANNAREYRHELPAVETVYVGTTWPDPGAEAAGQTIAQAAAGAKQPARIIGHMGQMTTTGSTYGLKFLLHELAPRLARALSDVPYEIHVIGAGEPVRALRPLLAQPGIVRHGFLPAEGLDAALRSSDVFLLLNNANPYYRAIYSRTILAWSLGLCLGTHANSRDAVPELSEENALVSADPDALAQLIRRAVTEPAFNQSIRQAGRRTYERHFTPAVFTEKIAHAIQARRPAAPARQLQDALA